MKLLLLTPFWRPVTGGVGRFVEALRDRLLASGHRVSVIALSGDATEGVTTFSRSTAVVLGAVLRQIHRERPEAIHVHGHWRLLLPAICHKLLHPGLRVIFTFHTTTRTRGLRRRLFRFLLNRCDVVTAVSADLLARESARYRLKTDVSVTYPGAVPAPLVVDQDVVRRQYGLHPRDPVLLTVMPLHYPLKASGLVDLIRSIPYVLKRQPGTQLVIVGDGVYRPALENLVGELDLTPHVRFLGTLADPTPIYAAADLVCHISYQDELPLAILQAMALGKSVLCSPVGGIPEVIRDGIEGVHGVGSPEDIARSILNLLEDPTRRRELGDAARERVRSEFTWDHLINRLSPIYGLRVRKAIHVTVDVEQDYHLREKSYRGVEEALPRILDILLHAGIRGSFFVAADVAQRFPDLLRRMLRDGHHVGSHALSHSNPPIGGRAEDIQRLDVDQAMSVIRPYLSEPASFRAPNFLIDGASVGALTSSGVRVDSSVVPGRRVRKTRGTPRIDFRGSPSAAYRVSASTPATIGRMPLVEVPVTANPYVRGSPLGLGYLHSVGVGRALSAIEASPASQVTFLIHPWEAIDYPVGAPLPSWMRLGCRSDLRDLEELLRTSSTQHEMIPFARLLDHLLEPNPAWWSPGRWGMLTPKPRIVFVTNVYRPVVGGVSEYLAGLVGTLRSNGFRTTVLAYPPRLVLREARARKAKSRKLFHAAFGALCLMRIAAWRLQGETVIVHSHGASFCLATGFFARCFGALAVHTFHSPIRYRSRVLSWLAPRLDALLFVAPETQGLYETTNHVRHDRTAIVPGGVRPGSDESSRDPASALRQKGIPAESFLCLYVGRVVPEKGVDLAIEAVSVLARTGHDARLIVAGPSPGPEGSAYGIHLRQLSTRLGVGDRLHFLGEVGPDELDSLYRSAHCLLVPSRWEEPAPMVTAEAMSRGLPVIAAAVGGLRRRVQDRQTGYLVPPEDSAALAQAIAHLIDSPEERSRLGTQAREWVSRHASVERMAQQHEGIYLALLREARLT